MNTTTQPKTALTAKQIDALRGFARESTAIEIKNIHPLTVRSLERRGLVHRNELTESGSAAVETI